MKKTKIEWCDHTFNPWTGCGHVSAGCDHCYAAAQSRRFGRDFSRRVRTSERYWKEPLKWNRERELLEKGVSVLSPHVTESVQEKMVSDAGPRPLVFCGSLCDWLDGEVPIEWLADLLVLIYDTPNLNWLLLTKRPENWLKRMGDAVARLALRGGQVSWLFEWRDGSPPSNVWIGATVENQEMADKRIPELLKIPAAGRFLSCEPLLGHIDIARFLHSEKYWIGKCSKCGWVGSTQFAHGGDPIADTGDYSDAVCPMCTVCREEWNPLDEFSDDGINWVICGGESGSNTRPMHPAWPRSLRDQCAAANVPFFFKQWGEWVPARHFENERGFRALPTFAKEKRWKYKCVGSTPWGLHELPGCAPEAMYRVGKKEAGCLLDGTEHRNFPKGLKK